ncbi:MAG: Flp family type IVb pilin [Hoeflea sp.]|jgi:pilus assembly protein Flp/PilA|uniref:Flp family type IVb pilin n=1 Tax=Hoeflea sp. TaxID=1940281 RepID=UPI0032EDDE53
MKSTFVRFIRSENGATAIEYGLITALISAAIIGGGLTLGNTINSTLSGTAEHLQNSQ